MVSFSIHHLVVIYSVLDSWNNSVYILHVWMLVNQIMNEIPTEPSVSIYKVLAGIVLKIVFTVPDVY